MWERGALPKLKGGKNLDLLEVLNLQLSGTTREAENASETSSGKAKRRMFYNDV